MKYRILLLGLLVCAVIVAAADGTLGGYTTVDSYSVNIVPVAPAAPAAERATQKETAQAEDDEAPKGAMPAETGAVSEEVKPAETGEVPEDSEIAPEPAEDAPLETSDKEV